MKWPWSKGEGEIIEGEVVGEWTEENPEEEIAWAKENLSPEEFKKWYFQQLADMRSEAEVLSSDTAAIKNELLRRGK